MTIAVKFYNDRVSSIPRRKRLDTYVEITGHLEPSDFPEMTTEPKLHNLYTNDEESYGRNLQLLDE